MSDVFTYTAVTRVTPSGGSVVGGTPVTITGFGFDSYYTGSVTFGGVAATSIVVVNNTTIRALTPEHNAGAVDVVVSGIGTLEDGYTYAVVRVVLPRVPVLDEKRTLDGVELAKFLMAAKKAIETAPVISGGQVVGPISPDQIPQLPYTRIDLTDTPRLLGRTTAGAGEAEQITVAGGLSLSGGVLSIAGLPSGFVVGDLLYAISSTQLARLADVSVGSYLRSGGVATAPLWSTLKLPNAVTSGSVVFGSATDTYGQNNAHLFWDNSAEKLGIGTTTPKRKLHVNDGGGEPISALLPGAVVALLTGSSAGTLQGLTASATAHLPGLYLRSIRARGTLPVPTIVQVDDLIGFWESEGFNGTSRVPIGNIGMFIHDVSGSNLSGYINFLISSLGAGPTERVRMTPVGTGFGVTVPTAVAHLKAGTTAASTAPLKFTSGPLLTAPEPGAIEFLTDNYYATITTGSARKTFAFIENGQALTKVDDTNVTLTLGGSPSTALLAATSLTLGWTGTLSVARGGTGTGTALTAGSVVFAGASGVYSQDNANFFWDDTNNRLGLGVNASLAAVLHIKGAGTTSSTVSTLVEDSGGTDIWSQRDDSTIGWGKNVTLAAAAGFYYVRSGADFSGALTITNNVNGITAQVGAIGLQLRYAGNQEFTRGEGIAVIVESSNTHSGNSLSAMTGSARIATAGGLATTLIGGAFDARSDGSTGATITTLAGLRATMLVQNAGVTATNAYGLQIQDITNSGTMTNTYGIHIGDVTAGTQTNTAYSLYSSDANALNYFAGSVQQDAKTTRYNAIATAGWGVPAIYGSGRSTAQTAAVASVAAYTVGAADGSFIVSANVNVTTSTTHNFTVQVTYTDETNTAQTLTLTLSTAAGVLVTAITNVTGAGPYEGVPLHIRCKSATAITVKTAGTFTTVTYNVEGSISQVA